eukprot:jgi/Mesvir1/28309/Mv04829-RA.1
MGLYDDVEQWVRRDSSYVAPPLPDFEAAVRKAYPIPSSAEEDCGRAPGAQLKSAEFLFKDGLVFVAHGSYGATPRATLTLANSWRRHVEYQPVDFFYKELYPQLVASIRELASFVCCEASDLVLVPNVEFAINSVLQSLVGPVYRTPAQKLALAAAELANPSGGGTSLDTTSLFCSPPRRKQRSSLESANASRRLSPSRLKPGPDTVVVGPHQVIALTEGGQVIPSADPMGHPGYLVTDSLCYGAVLGVLRATAAAWGLELIIVDLAPASHSGTLTEEGIMSAYAGAFAQLALSSARVAICVFAHVASPTAVLLPVRDLCALCRKLGVVSLIDGAHALGLVPLDLSALGPDFYTSNGHKWLMNNRGAGFLYIHPRFKGAIHPVCPSWGLGQGLHAEFVWQGTMDYTPMLTIPFAIHFLRWCGRGSAERAMARNASLARWAASMLVRAWNTGMLAPPNMCAGGMCSVRVPPATTHERWMVGKRRVCSSANGAGGNAADAGDSCSMSSLHDVLLSEYHIEVPVFTHGDHRYVRLSAHIYNCQEDFVFLAKAVLAVQGTVDDVPWDSILAEWKEPYE